MSTINDLIADMKDLAEVEKFAEKQYQTILELNKKITELNVEIATLKTQLAQAGHGSLHIPGQNEKPSEQMICEVQLALLNQASMQGPLTAEESKKVETYSKILATFRSKEKAPEKPIERLDSDTLLKLVADNE